MRSLGSLKLISRLLLCTLALISCSESFATPFTVVSFNTWGVPFTVKDTWRYGVAMNAIKKINPDFIFLEELFSHKGRKEFQDNRMYPWIVNGPHAFPRLVPGGIRLLSKYPVISSAKMAYAHCVKDDCLSKKGALLAVVQLPDGQKLNLVGTHLNARGDDSVRIDQMGQLDRFIKNFADPTAPVLISGDFNFGPGSLAYQYTMDHMNVRDGWVETHDASDLGLTYNTDTNHYAHDYCIQTNSGRVVDRLDLNLLRGDNLKQTESHVIFNQEPFLSDHFGLYSAYDVTPATASVAPDTKAPVFSAPASEEDEETAPDVAFQE